MKVLSILGGLSGEKRRKVYQSVVRPTMLHGSEYWAVDKKIEHRMSVTETKMLRRMSGVSRKRGKEMNMEEEVALIVDKTRVNILKWFGHVTMRREKSEALRAVIEMNIEGSRIRRRPKKRWLDMIKNDMRTVGVCACR